MFVDVHCHLTDPVYENVGVQQIVTNATQNGVGIMINSGCCLRSSKVAQEISRLYDNVYFCVGFHPDELHTYKDGDLEELRLLCADEKCVAVGEIGLDYHYENNPSPSVQRELFIKQLQLADEVGLPVVIHSRDAAGETFAILEEHKSLLKKGGLMHCYSYSPEMMERFLGLGFYFSFGGPSTFKNAKKVKTCVEHVPGTRLLSETDCPYLTPEPYRGVFPNEPKNVKYVVENFATLRNEKVEELEKQILQNAKELFFRLK